MNTVMMISPQDDVAVAIEPVATGETVLVNGQELVALEAIPIYHKIAVRDIPKGSKVRKYGEHIGEALCDIARGAYVHVHNVCGVREDLDNK